MSHRTGFWLTIRPPETAVAFREFFTDPAERAVNINKRLLGWSRPESEHNVDLGVDCAVYEAAQIRDIPPLGRDARYERIAQFSLLVRDNPATAGPFALAEDAGFALDVLDDGRSDCIETSYFTSPSECHDPPDIEMT